MSESKKPVPIAIRKLKVKNFKALDDFEIEFPKPRMKNDPDVFVMGSKNGVGKTSVLEACSLLLLFSSISQNNNHDYYLRNFSDNVDFSELFVRSGEKEAVIEGVFIANNKEIVSKLRILKLNHFQIERGSGFPLIPQNMVYGGSEDYIQNFLKSLIGLIPESLFIHPVIYFHSFRKVLEGNPDIRSLIDGEQSIRRIDYGSSLYRIATSTLKIEILRLMMGQANLFENLDDKQSSDILKKLNSLVERYAGGTITKLRPSRDNTIDFRIQPTNGGESFSFDGLSSGQKEIIHTLFLIWYYSRSNPRIVLIDEPELHLNAEWHRDFVKLVHDLAPQNQYIIATHSVDIFSSVDEDRRVLLVGKGEK